MAPKSKNPFRSFVPDDDSLSQRSRRNVAKQGVYSPHTSVDATVNLSHPILSCPSQNANPRLTNRRRRRSPANVESLMLAVRRYMSLEELAFFPMFLPEPILPPLDFPRLLAPNDVNVNDQILSR